MVIEIGDPNDSWACLRIWQIEEPWSVLDLNDVCGEGLIRPFLGLPQDHRIV